jgi:tetratricopeptide (TPR) repeat protein
MRTARRSALALGLLLTFAAPQLALAGDPAPAAGAAAAPSADKVAEARKRYELGLKLYEEGNYEAARIEFERAQELAPSYRILYNIGLVYKQTNNYVDALRAFEKYLADGGAEVPADKKAIVDKEIAEIRPRIGRITVTTNVPGAEILLDDTPVGKAPLSEPIMVNPGVRRITVQAKGRIPSTRTVTVGSSENPSINVELAEPTTRIVEKENNPWTVPTIVGWSATGAGVIATVIFGVLAIDAQNQQNALLNKPGVTQKELDDARSKTMTMGTVTDVLGITSIVFAGVSTFFTIKALTWAPEKKEVKGQLAPRSFDLRVNPTGIMAVGTF